MRSLSLGLFCVGVLACSSHTPSPLDAGSDASSVDAGRDSEAPRDAGVDAADSAPADAGAGDSSAADSAMADAGPDPVARMDALLARLHSASLTDADADELLHEVAWDEGWPLTDGSRWLFVTRWDAPAGALSLVSDINAWDTMAAPATRLATGHHYAALVARAGFLVPPRGAKYKWFAPADVYRAPPAATAYGYDDFGEFGWVAPPTDAPWLERFPDLRSSHLEAPRTLRARLPGGFDPARGSTARTLLLHDGQNVFDPGAFYGGWHLDDALAAGPYADVVALSVDNTPDRMDAYAPAPDDMGDGTRVGGRADDYLALLEDEALPFFRARYGILARGRSFAMLGSSMGGLVSLHFALSHDGEAACVMAMSSTLGWGAFDPALSGADALVNRWPTLGHGGTSLYLDSGGGVTGTCADGDGDGVFEDAVQTDGYCVTRQLRDVLLGLGYRDGTDLFYAWDAGAPHNEGAWRTRVPGALDACTRGGWSTP